MSVPKQSGRSLLEQIAREIIIREGGKRIRLSKHKDALKARVGDYIQNKLPINLLRVSDMTLVGRDDLEKKINEDIEQISHCDQDNCHCLRDIKRKLQYSTLSHRWGSRELTFGDLQNFDTTFAKSWAYWMYLHKDGTRVEKIQACYRNTPYESSAEKLVKFLQVSAEKQCEYAWADTLCINKESSAELAQSLRSMYAWYQDSHICIVHLGNTTSLKDLKQDPWFTRGWTLQELLAPKRIAFFSKSWKEIATRDGNKMPSGNSSFWSIISSTTGISTEELLDFKPGLRNIGTRLSWASKRKTKVIEDMAYCLIGIFDVDLTIEYGENEKAFYRLQDKILERGGDPSLFNWAGQASTYNSMFARSPECFYGYPNPVPQSSSANRPSNPVNYILRMPLALHDISKLHFQGWKDLRTATAFAILGPSEPGKHLVVALEEIKGGGQYKRLKAWSTAVDAKLLDARRKEIIIR